MNPIYKPRGAAAEYGDYALNIYTGCPHRCYYCFAPSVLHRNREQFHSVIEPRKNIVEETAKQIEREGITDKLVHLCFTCDPYPYGYDTTVTREIISLLKSTGNNVQILTKGDGSRDLDLLDKNDWYGITLDGTPSNDLFRARVNSLAEAHSRGINTWVSFEPVTDERRFFVELHLVSEVADKVKIGKLNYHQSEINWKEFGEKAEALCQSLGIDYYIKESLRAEMSTEKEIKMKRYRNSQGFIAILRQLNNGTYRLRINNAEGKIVSAVILNNDRDIRTEMDAYGNDWSELSV